MNTLNNTYNAAAETHFMLRLVMQIRCINRTNKCMFAYCCRCSVAFPCTSCPRTPRAHIYGCYACAEQTRKVSLYFDGPSNWHILLK